MRQNTVHNSRNAARRSGCKPIATLRFTAHRDAGQAADGRAGADYRNDYT